MVNFVNIFIDPWVMKQPEKNMKVYIIQFNPFPPRGSPLTSKIVWR